MVSPEDNPPDDSSVKKIIEIKPIPNTTPEKKVKRKRSFFSALKIWVLFLLFLAVVAWAVNRYYLHQFNLGLQDDEAVQAPATPDNFDVTIKENLQKKDEAKDKLLSGAAEKSGEGEVEPIKPEDKKAVETNQLKDELAALNEKFGHLEAQNNNIMVYFSARDLKDSIDDSDNFKRELEFLRELGGDNADISGKIDILEQATANGIVTRAKLLADLDLLEKNIENSHEKSFSQSITSAFDSLVKVTKVKGEVSSTDYQSIIKRAQIALSKEKISAGQLQAVIGEVAKLGKPAESWVKEAGNLQRVLEVTDNLIGYAKSKVTE